MSRNIKNVIATIDYIEDHLHEKLDLETVAKAVHYSKYHLHRMFTNTIGLTIQTYVQRRKLTEAAKSLVLSDKSILEIALSAGYESQQSFTDIFKTMYKKSPNQYREEEEFYPLQLRYILKENPTNLEEYIKNKQALILKDSETVIGIMAFNKMTGSIDFFGVHPQYRKRGIAKAFCEKALYELVCSEQISVTTFRKGDKADTGYRKIWESLGFVEAELLIEFGYPTQRFILPKLLCEPYNHVL